VTKSVFSGRYDRFKELLAERRRSAGLTQADLAIRLARPQSFVSKYERGERRIDVIEFLEVAQAIGFDPAEFLRELKWDRTTLEQEKKLRNIRNSRN
jgi:transcriptional regulator with XRE-family HTH domain